MTIRASSSSASAARTGGAVLGIMVFLIGIALVGYVFMTARVLFDAPPPTIPTPPPAPILDPNASASAVAAASAAAATSAGPSATSVVGQALLGFLQHLLVLLLMCIAGSVIASRGIELFFKAIAAANDAPPPPAAAD